MDGQSTRGSIEVSLACNRSALTAVQQERQRALYRQLRADVEEVLELEDGYAFRHSADKKVLLARRSSSPTSACAAPSSSTGSRSNALVGRCGYA